MYNKLINMLLSCYIFITGLRARFITHLMKSEDKLLEQTLSIIQESAKDTTSISSGGSISGSVSNSVGSSANVAAEVSNIPSIVGSSIPRSPSLDDISSLSSGSSVPELPKGVDWSTILTMGAQFAIFTIVACALITYFYPESWIKKDSDTPNKGDSTEIKDKNIDNSVQVKDKSVDVDPNTCPACAAGNDDF